MLILCYTILNMYYEGKRKLILYKKIICKGENKIELSWCYKIKYKKYPDTHIDT